MKLYNLKKLQTDDVLTTWSMYEQDEPIQEKEMVKKIRLVDAPKPTGEEKTGGDGGGDDDPNAPR